MSVLHLKIVTPQKVVLEKDIKSITLPSADGEITILPHHENLFSLLNEGIIRFKFNSPAGEEEDYLAIGGGYAQTDGENINVLVSKAYGHEEIDNNLTEKAISEANNILKNSRDINQRQEAASLLRRSLIDMKLLRKKRRTNV
jgi:F-type H+-transporting ATPase subunit epsilon